MSEEELLNKHFKRWEGNFTADEPTGGTHMSLVLAGNYGITFDEAEKIKKILKEKGKFFK